VRRAERRAEHCIELYAGVYADIRIGVYRDNSGDVRTDNYIGDCRARSYGQL